MLGRIHLIIGIAAVAAFLLSGQLLGHHHPVMEQLPAETQMMYIWRHIYLLGGALVNVVLGIYFQLQPSSWRRVLQIIGSIFVIASVISLSMAFLAEPPLGMAGRSWRSLLGIVALFFGVMTHLVATAGARRIDTTL